MAVNLTTLPRSAIAPKFNNGDEFLRSIGDIPMSRIRFTPWPGTATEQDLLKMVEREKRMCELIDGTLVEKVMGFYESILAVWLGTYLNIFLDSHPIGVVAGEQGMMRLASGQIRMPDISFISHDRLEGHDLSNEPVPTIGPDLAIEIISDGNSAAEMRQKTREYFQSGAILVWLVYPKRRIVEVFEQPSDEPTRVLTENDILDGGMALPGFTLELTKLFSKLPK